MFLVNGRLSNITFQSLQDQLNIALENERRAKEEVETLKEEMKAERASVQAARVIEKQKRDEGINRQMDLFKQSQEAVNQRVDSLVHSLEQQSIIEIKIAGVTQGMMMLCSRCYIIMSLDWYTLVRNVCSIL